MVRHLGNQLSITARPEYLGGDARLDSALGPRSNKLELRFTHQDSDSNPFISLELVDNRLEKTRTTASSVPPANRRIPSPTTSEQIEDAVERITTAFQASIRLTTTQVRLSNYAKAWFDEEARDLYQQMKQTSKASPEHATIRQQWKTLVHSKKTRQFRVFAEGLDHSTCWKALKHLQGRQSISEVSHLETSQGTITDPAEITKELAARYLPPYPPSPLPEKDRAQRLWNARRQNQPPLLEEGYVAHQEKWDEIGHPRKLSAPGIDGLPFLVFHKCRQTITPYFQSLFTGILLSGHFPEQWKTTRHLNICKPREDMDRRKKTTDPLVSYHVKQRSLKAFWPEELLAEKLKILPEAQFGFRKHRSTLQPLWRLTTDAMDAINRKQRMLAISFDLEGAYDRVCPTIPWKKLHDAQFPAYLLHILWNITHKRSALISS